MKTDIKTLLEFAGVDTSKGKAKQLVENAGQYHIVEIVAAGLPNDQDTYYSPPSPQTAQLAKLYLQNNDTDRADLSEVISELESPKAQPMLAAMKAHPDGQLYTWFGMSDEDGKPSFIDYPNPEDDDHVGWEMQSYIFVA